MMDHVDHINTVVSDLKRSVRFHTEVLGFEETWRARREGDWMESVVGLRRVPTNVLLGHREMRYKKASIPG